MTRRLAVSKEYDPLVSEKSVEKDQKRWSGIATSMQMRVDGSSHVRSRAGECLNKLDK